MKFQKHSIQWYILRAVIGVLMIAACVSVFIYVWFLRDMQAGEARIAQGSQLAETECGVIEYADVGSGIPVLSIHGSGGGYDQGLVIGEALPAGFRVIAPSRFGYLNSPYPEDHSVVAQADMYACLLDYLGLEKVAVIAFSAGGTSALQFAQRHPDRVESLVMISAISNVRPVRDADEDTQAALLTDFVYWAATTAAPNAVLQFFGVSAEAQAQLSDVEMERAQKVLRIMNPLRMRTAGLAHDSNEPNLFDGATFDLESITAKTLVVHATDDTFIPIVHGEYTAAHIPGAKLVTFDTGGHFLAVRDDALAVISDFITQNYS